ncbi:3-keto-5-aminohexanoate cleavage protein [Persicimonas caeni]|uniref:3-keto-5-aminohexanoate cleavage protein n=1 Tax=Persicimonas caeni TaxID=2292766 RepID=A0A4Y6PWC1_PERCE|nr:3-keto-5-aminohexanoate cleavage protein [Persicimonas caeni]QDG52035.1 3-keto-5-aminohexanoate cleavage protein [Persicimonas caeni]QED33256.1 3-keto-5-aminohexanoate cleavage protein [Persicimonas caeni]
MMTPLIITAAVDGAETMREHNPNVPYTPEEIAQEAVRCREAGASMVHVHGREDDGTPTQARDVFEQILNKIRERSDILVQFSTGGAVWMSVEERIEALDLRPDMATLTTGTVNFGEDVFMNSLPMIRQIAERLQEFDITPEIEIFDTGMVDTAMRLVKEGLLEEPLHFDFVLGVPGGMGGRPENLEFLVDMIPEGSTWSVAGIGRHELPLAYKAIDMGGHVRVGLEDNIFVEKGVLAKGSWELVEKVVEYAEEQGREIATPEVAKEILGVG